MKILVKKGKITEFTSEAVVVPHFEDEKELQKTAKLLDKKSGGLIKEIIDRGDFEGKHLQVSIIYTRGAIPAKRIVLVGIGKKTDFTMEKLREAFATAAMQVRSLKLKDFSTSLDFIYIDQPLDQITQAVVEGVLLGLYQFTPFKTVEKDKIKGIEEFTLVEEKDEACKIIKIRSKNSGDYLDGRVFYERYGFHTGKQNDADRYGK